MLGFYKKAYDLFVLPESQLLAPLTNVVVSTLSRIRDDREQFQRFFLGTISVLALIGMGIGADFALVGKDIIRLLLGPGWDEAGRIFALFGPGIGAMLLYETHGWIHLSIGRPERWLFWGLIEFFCTASLFLLAYIGGHPELHLLGQPPFSYYVSRLLVCREADWTWARVDHRRYLEIVSCISRCRLCDGSGRSIHAASWYVTRCPDRASTDSVHFVGVF